MITFGAASGLSGMCRHFPKKIVEIDKVNYWTADEDHVMLFEGDLVINLTKIPNVHKLPEEFVEFGDTFDIHFKELMVPWPDFGIPRVSSRFWRLVHSVANKKKYKDVCIQCGHAHGRTGTALSSILIANCGYGAKEAVEFVREAHCKDSVESEEQCGYLVSLDREFNNRVIKSNEDMPLGSIEIKIMKHRAEQTG